MFFSIDSKRCVIWQMEENQANAIEGSSQKEDEHVNATDVANEEGSSENLDRKKKGCKRSSVQDHFILEDDGKAKCPYCKAKMASNSKKNGI